MSNTPMDEARECERAAQAHALTREFPPETADIFRLMLEVAFIEGVQWQSRRALAQLEERHSRIQKELEAIRASH